MPQSYSSSLLSSNVKSLKIASAHSKTSPAKLGELELIRAKSHLSAFTNLQSLTLAAVSSIASGQPEKWLGSLAATVRKLKLSYCLLDEQSFFALLRLFTHLESLELDGNLWVYNPRIVTEGEPPTLRGSLTALEFTEDDAESITMLDSLAIARVEYHTIVLGPNHHSTFRKFNVLLKNCGDHLKTLILTSPESGPRYDGQAIAVGRGPDLTLDLSYCKGLVEIHGRFYHSKFEGFIPLLWTVKSPRFRRLSIFIAPPMPAIDWGAWAQLDAAVIALVGRVRARAASDMMEVLFSSHTTAFAGVQLSQVKRALPLTASDARVSVRTEYLPLPLNR